MHPCFIKFFASTTELHASNLLKLCNSGSSKCYEIISIHKGHTGPSVWMLKYLSGPQVQITLMKVETCRCKTKQ